MTHIDSIDGFKPGDLVFIGEPAPLDRKMTWRISTIDQAADGLYYATIRSGQSGQTRVVPTTRLTHFRAVETAS